jgi:hypothetical protein
MPWKAPQENSVFLALFSPPGLDIAARWLRAQRPLRVCF